MRLNLITKVNAGFALVLLVLSLMGGGLLAVAATAAALLLINRERAESETRQKGSYRPPRSGSIVS
jgi:hypothetical protein